MALSAQHSPEEGISASVWRLRLGYFDLDGFSSTERSLQSESLGCHLTWFLLLALHLKFLSPGKECIYPLLHSGTVDHMPWPLVAAFSELVPSDQSVVTCLPFGKEALKLVRKDIWDLSNDALVLNQSWQHLNKALFSNGFLAFGMHLSKQGTHLVLLPLGERDFIILSELSSIFRFLRWYRQWLSFITSFLEELLKRS